MCPFVVNQVGVCVYELGGPWGCAVARLSRPDVRRKRVPLYKQAAVAAVVDVSDASSSVATCCLRTDGLWGGLPQEPVSVVWSPSPVSGVFSFFSCPTKGGLSASCLCPPVSSKNDFGFSAVAGAEVGTWSHRVAPACLLPAMTPSRRKGEPRLVLSTRPLTTAAQLCLGNMFEMCVNTLLVFLCRQPAAA